MDEFFGVELILNGDVKYVGEGEDPSKNPYMIAYANALKKIYQPERSKREDLEYKLLYKEPNVDEMSPTMKFKYEQAEKALRCGALNTMET